ncbi:MFS transporter [Streptomyces spirodelae]|uniref:MFS transporter n=1 Tax=Streptomyces spirodelae TaxID=2812904 RepID=A0ABS3WQU4_9ACTN|nr:MFS transporter [Streptomyces spirodelae]MBO8185494.1 MFS transporter [Streptomyces spirodelae]
MTTYLATAFLARLADEGVGIALALLAVERTAGHSPELGAYVLAAWLAPHAVAAPLVGALAARAGAPRLFHCCALAVFGAAIALLGLTLGRAPLPLVLAAALVGGSVGPVVSGGLSSLVASLGPAGQPRTRAFALDATTYNAAAVTAPAAVSAIAAAASASLATTLLAASATSAALLSTALRLPTDRHAPGAPDPAPGPGVLTIGFRALWHVRPLRAITLATCVAFLGVGALPVTSVLLAQQRGGPGAGGVLMTAFAVGGLAGSLGTARWRRAPGPVRLALFSLLLTATALAAAALIPQLPLVVALFALAGLGDGPLLTATLRLRADHAPEGARTQVFTLGAGLKLTSAALGTAFVGTLAHLPAGALTLLVAALHLAAGALLWALGPALVRKPTGPGISTDGPLTPDVPGDGL